MSKAEKKLMPSLRAMRMKPDWEEARPLFEEAALKFKVPPRRLHRQLSAIRSKLTRTDRLACVLPSRAAKQREHARTSTARVTCTATFFAAVLTSLFDILTLDQTRVLSTRVLDASNCASVLATRPSCKVHLNLGSTLHQAPAATQSSTCGHATTMQLECSNKRTNLRCRRTRQQKPSIFII